MLSVSAAFPSRIAALHEPELCAQYNPKELGVDKSVPWFTGPKDPCNVAAHGVPGLRSVTVPKLDGSSKDHCALTPGFRPNPTGDGTTQLVPAKMPGKIEWPNLDADGLGCDRHRSQGFMDYTDDSCMLEALDKSVPWQARIASHTRPFSDGLLVDLSGCPLRQAF